jgi:hypothetical protein
MHIRAARPSRCSGTERAGDETVLDDPAVQGEPVDVPITATLLPDDVAGAEQVEEASVAQAAEFRCHGRG